MAYSKIESSLLAFLLVIMMITWCSDDDDHHHVMAAESSDCTNEIISMSSCLSYIQGKSSTPSSGCCSQLKSVVGSHPECLCLVLNGGGSSLGLSINQTQALLLPQVCQVDTPPVSQCNATAPANSPSTLPSGKGSNTVPSTDNNSSDANSFKIKANSPPFMFFIFFFASRFIFSS